jgi:hypothetical protein
MENRKYEGVGGVSELSLHPLAPTQTPTPSHMFIFDILTFGVIQVIRMSLFWSSLLIVIQNIYIYFISGLPFSAFIEAFFLLSQHTFPGAHSLLESVSQLVGICVRNLNSSLQTSLSPRQYLPHRATTAPSTTKSVFPLFFDVL